MISGKATPALMTVTVRGVRRNSFRNARIRRPDFLILSVDRRDSHRPARGLNRFVSRLFIFKGASS